MRTFHVQPPQLAFLGSLDLKGHDFLFDLGALALGAPELLLLIFWKGQHEIELAAALFTPEIVTWHRWSPLCETEFGF
jgi:hypothetical protein